MQSDSYLPSHARVHVVLRKKSFIRHFRYLKHCGSGASIVKDAPIYLSPSVTHIDSSTQLSLFKSPRPFLKKVACFG